MTDSDAGDRLAGGAAGGAELEGGTVRRARGPWTPSVHAVLGHLEDQVEAEGFTEFDRRLDRLTMFLDAYGWNGSAHELLPIIRDRTRQGAAVLRRTARGGDAVFEGMVEIGRDHDLDVAAAEIGGLIDPPTTPA